MFWKIVIRERTSFWYMVYGVYLYFCSTSLRRASKALEPWIARSYGAIWLWVQRLAPIAESFKVDRASVGCILVDETYIRLDTARPGFGLHWTLRTGNSWASTYQEREISWLHTSF